MCWTSPWESKWAGLVYANQNFLVSQFLFEVLCWVCIVVVWNSADFRETINTGPGTRGPRIRGPEDRGPKDPTVALSFYDRNGTCVNVLRSNVRLYCFVSQSPHCYTHSRPLHTRLYYLLAFCKPKNSLLYCMQDYKCNEQHWSAEPSVQARW